MTEITWTMPVVLDLFFAGLAAGAFCFSVLASRREGRGFHVSARAAALLAPIAIGVGVSMLVLDLHYKTRFWRTMTVLNGDSPMSLGAWLLTVFSTIAVLYAVFWVPDALRAKVPLIGRWPLWSRQAVRRGLGAVGVPVALLVSIYTGVLLSATSIPLWRNPVLPALFCLSSMATGFAAGLLTALLFSPGMRQDLLAGPFRWLQGAYRVLLPFYLLAALGYVLWFLTSGVRGAVLALVAGGNGLIWWLGPVGVGIVLPMVLGFGKTKATPAKAFVVLGALLAGGFLMRLFLVYAGQEQVIDEVYRLAYLP